MKRLYKPCPNCGAEVKPRVIREIILISPHDEHEKYNIQKFIEDEYWRLFQINTSEKLIVCSKCSWAINI